MRIAIRLEPNGSKYMDKEICSRMVEFADEEGNILTQRVISDETLSQPPYNYSFVEVDAKYSDCQPSDFNTDLTFSIDKYNTRKQSIIDEERVFEIRKRLNELSQDFTQAYLGAVFEDIEDRKTEFKTLHNELRLLQGKGVRIYAVTEK